MKTIAIALLGAATLCAPQALADDTAPAAPTTPAAPPKLAALPPPPAPVPPVTAAPAAPPATAAPAAPAATAALPPPPPQARSAPRRAAAPVVLAPTEPVTLAEADPTASPDAAAEAQGPLVNHRVEMWRLELGYRGSFVNDAGYGPFSTNQYFVQASMTASRTLWHEGSWSFAPGVGFDFGGSSATARGQATSMSMQRVSIPLEGRRHFGPWGYAFVRLAPGLALENAELDDASAPSALKKNAWMFSGDASAGFAWLITPRFDRFEQKARVWLQADVGYGWVAGEDLALASSGGSGNTGGVDLGTLTMAGPFFRLGGAVSF